MSAAASFIREMFAMKCVSVQSFAADSKHLRLLSETDLLIKVNC